MGFRSSTVLGIRAFKASVSGFEGLGEGSRILGARWLQGGGHYRV